MNTVDLSYLHAPKRVAIIGASDDPDKIGGRPIRYMKEVGFTGQILPVNPGRPEVQGLPAFRSIDELPTDVIGPPDVAVVAVPGQAAVDAVVALAALGVPGAIIMASGFGETGSPDGVRMQTEMLAAAAEYGMRLVGPNSQGLANFGTGAVLSFSTMFVEEPPMDGPIGIISQSGAMASVPYGLLRRRGLGVRYVHGTGNDIDLGVGDIAEAVVGDPDIRLVLLYLEKIVDPTAIERAARAALQRGVPIVALMGGRSAEGQRAAQSHTGALANEHRVVDAFFERCGIWRAASMADFIASAELYLQDWHPTGRRLAIVSNSGAVCVLGADAAIHQGLELSKLAAQTTSTLTAALPAFATKTNPIDVTAALLTDSSLFGKVLPVLMGDDSVDACLLGIPVSGRGYDVERFAADAAKAALTANKPIVVSTPQPKAAAEFRKVGLVVFEEEASAIGALSQLLKHNELVTRARAFAPLSPLLHDQPGEIRPLSEAAALKLLRDAGISTVDAILCSTPDEAAAAFRSLGSRPVAVKGCPAEATHKSELGLVRLNVTSAEAAAAIAAEMLETMADLGIAADGVLLAGMVGARTEVLLGAHVDEVFGPVVMVGAGGKYVEVLDDVATLLPPFDTAQALRSIGTLRVARLLAGVRGERPADLDAWAAAAVTLGRLLLSDSRIRSVDINPLMLAPAGSSPESGAIAVDAVVVTAR